MQDFATSLGGLVTVPSVSFFILCAAVIFACCRCNSILPITKLWCQKVLGGDGYKSSLIKDIDDQVEDVLRFNIFYGAKFKTFESLERFHKKVLKYSLDIPTLMKARNYFSYENFKIRKRFKLEIIMIAVWNFLLLLFFMFSLFFFVPLAADKSLLVEFENDGNWFLINEDRISSSNYIFNSSYVKNWSFSIDNCNESEINKVTKLSEKTVKIICEVTENNEEKKYLSSEIKNQSRASMMLSFVGFCAFTALVVFLFRCSNVSDARKHASQQYKKARG